MVAFSYRAVDREQGFLLPPDMRSWLTEDHLAFFIIEVVEQLDTTAFHARSRRGGAGRAGYDPDMLLSVVLYAYAVGQRSSRTIERLCGTDVAFRVLCASDTPDHTTIARFRKDHEALFADVFAQVLVMCARAGMGKVGVVAIDGTKIAANASQGATRSEKSLRKELAAIEAAAREQAARVVTEAAAVDEEEDALFGVESRGDELAPQFTDPKRRAAAIKAALAEIDRIKVEEQAKDAPAAAFMELLRAGIMPKTRMPKSLDRSEVELAKILLYRMRIEDPATPREVVSAARRELRSAQRRLEVERARREDAGQEAGGPDGCDERSPGGNQKTFKVNLTDPQSRVMKTRNGWIQGFNAQTAVSDDHLILAVDVTTDTSDSHWFTTMMDAAVAAAKQMAMVNPALAGGCTSEAVTNGGISLVLADAGYFSEDNITAPGPDRLIAPGKRRDMEKAASKNPASGPIPPDLSPTDTMRFRMREPANLAQYKRRGATVEPVNAHLKDGAGLRRFARRGLNAARSELHLAATVVNLTKLFRFDPAVA